MFTGTQPSRLLRHCGWPFASTTTSRPSVVRERDNRPVWISSTSERAYWKYVSQRQLPSPSARSPRRPAVRLNESLVILVLRGPNSSKRREVLLTRKMPSPSASKNARFAAKKSRSGCGYNGLVSALVIATVPVGRPELVGDTASGAC